MPDEAISTPTPDSRPHFDFQLMGPLVDPRDWYWQAEDGRAYSSKREEIITSDDATYAEWVKAGYVPTNWPRDLDGKQTDDALREVLTAVGKKLP